MRKRGISLFIIALFFCSTTIVSCKGKSQKSELYRGESEVSIEAKYMGWACGNFTPQIMPIDNIDDTIKDKIEYGLTFYTNAGLEPPDSISEIGVPHNAFKITGFYYYTIEEGKKYLHPRFDLISWYPIAPFNIWTENATKIESNNSEKYHFKTNQSDIDNEFKKAHKYDPC